MKKIYWLALLFFVIFIYLIYSLIFSLGIVYLGILYLAIITSIMALIFGYGGYFQFKPYLKKKGKEITFFE